LRWRWGAIKGYAVFVGGQNAEFFWIDSVRPMLRTKYDVVVILYPEQVGGWTIAPGNKCKSDVESFPVAAVINTFEVGFSEVVELAVQPI
jgi:hypothetical protein